MANKLSSVANKVSDAGRNAVAGIPKRQGDGNFNQEGEEELYGGVIGGLVPRDPDKVLVLTILNAGGDPPGFQSEDHVLARNRQASRVVRMNLANLPGGGDGTDSADGFIPGAAGEKRTRFSLSHDEGSIGNTSDNLEAISEAASNHSVDSSLEDEVDQAEDPIIDNLSDMVSANVSGRGTPNVSGRDTPSSQVSVSP